MNAENIVKTLTYINYKHNRKLSPKTPAENWVAVYGEVAREMEKAYQQELLGEVYSDDSIPYNAEGEDQDEEDLSPDPWERHQYEDEHARVDALVKHGVSRVDAVRIVDDEGLAVFNEGSYCDKEVGTNSIYGFIRPE